MKSVIIIGKGPSVLQSTREFVESFDEEQFFLGIEKQSTCSFY